MPSTFIGLNIGTSGLYAYQANLNTTGHNIANAETEGYTRQIVGQKASDAVSVSNNYGMAGTGVTVTGVGQVRNEYYDVKFWSNSAIFGENSTKSQYMLQVENCFNEMNVSGFTKEFDNFYVSLEELSKDASSLVNRTSVANFAESLTKYFNSLSNNLLTLQKDTNYEIKNQIDNVNTMAQQIASLNKQINTLEAYGGTANDLRDQRSLLIDKLSEKANITVKETEVGNGVSTFTVSLNGQYLVDTNNYCTLEVIPRDKQTNQNDAIGLFDVKWASGTLAGQDFNLSDPNLGGILQALVQVRDGNNEENFTGVANGTKGDTSVKITNSSVNSINKLNLSSSGTITIGNKNYEYSSFDCKKNQSTGEYEYEFHLTTQLVKDYTNEEARVGDAIDYKGIPYYMAQLDEFVRTFTQKFNGIHNSGQDLSGNAGVDLFNINDIVGNGKDYNLEEDPAVSGFNSLDGTYYRMTAGNLTVHNDILNDPKKVAAAESGIDMANGIQNCENLNKLLALKTDNSMFKQGKPAAFLQTVVAEIAIDTAKAQTFAKSQEDLLSSITNQRLSISGVDIDEEAMNLIRFQNAYNLSAKLISVMNEIYNKLINEMGV